MAVSGRSTGRFSGTEKVLFLDLDIGYMDGSALNMHSYDRCIFSVSILDFNRKVNEKRGMFPNSTS